MPDPKKIFALPSDVQDNVIVTLQEGVAGFKVERAYAISADHGVQALGLPISRQGGAVSVTVPHLCYWTMLVLEGGAK
jgi:hypothetical protein